MSKFRIFTLVAAAAGAFVLNSCCKGCCTGILPAESLKPVPSFTPLYPGSGK